MSFTQPLLETATVGPSVSAHILEDAVRRAFRHASFYGQVCVALALSMLVTMVLISAQAYQADGHMEQLLKTAF